MNLAPIVLFVYNRPWHTKQTLEALAKNELADESILYIFADGAKENATPEQLQKIQEVRQVILSKQWCKEVHIEEKEKNWGLADSIVDGVTRIVNQYGKIIVLEDDIVTAKGFLKYMNDALILYENEGKVMHISGYMFPIKSKLPDTFFLYQTSSWGWATWARAWKNLEINDSLILSKIKQKNLVDKFNIDNTYNYVQFLENNISKINKTWAIKWYGNVFLQNGLCLFPSQSLVRNIGFDGSGENCGETNDVLLNQIFEKEYVDITKQKLVINNEALKQVKHNNSNSNSKENIYQKYNTLSMIKRFIKSIINRILLKLIDIDNLTEVVHQKNINKTINNCIKQVVIGEGSRFYEQSKVFNFQNRKDKINISHGTHIRGELLVFPFNGQITIGENCYIGEYTRVWSAESIKIGNHVLISHNVNIMDTNSHELDHNERAESFYKLVREGHPTIKPNLKTASITIEDYVWINFNAVISKGVTIGKGAIIAANAVVNTDVPPFTLFAGNPAKLIKYLNNREYDTENT